MKLLPLVLVVGATCSGSQFSLEEDVLSTTVDSFRPHRIPYHALLASEDASVWKREQEEAFQVALERDGIVSITDIPNLRKLKETAMSWELHQCLLETASHDGMGLTQSHTYEDGTIRRTMATHTTPLGSQSFFHLRHSKASSSDATAACTKLFPALEAVRTQVHTVTLAFANRLSSHLERIRTNPNTPWLTTTKDEEHYTTVQQIVEGGDHLEHFHSYQRVKVEAEEVVSEKSSAGRKDQPEKSTTIGMHTDQGLFLVFAPGRWVHRDVLAQPTHLSEGFAVQLRDGTVLPVMLEEPDDLIVMLGDGVHQYINHQLPCDRALHAVPHALSLAPNNDVNMARLWHGRMILPPPEAIHPQHGETFGALREALIRVSTTRTSSSDATAADQDHEREILSLGCSHPSLVARQLEDTACAADSLFCWHECQILTEYNVSDTICAQQGRSLSCVDPAGDLWDGTTHGDYFPGCAKNNDPPNNSTTVTAPTAPAPTTNTSPVSPPSPTAPTTRTSRPAAATTTTPAPAKAPPTSSASSTLGWEFATGMRLVVWMGIFVGVAGVSAA